MLIRDINFLEQIDHRDDIQGGSSVTSATSEKPGANASATSEGEITSIKTEAIGADGIGVSTVLGPDLNGTEVGTLDRLLLDNGLGNFMGITSILG